MQSTDTNGLAKLCLTNVQIDAAIDNIVTAIRQEGWQPDLVVAIHAGGLIPAAMLWYKLCKNPNQLVNGYAFGSIYAKSYLGTAKREEGIVIDIPAHVQLALNTAEHVLLVDDIYDTGDTLEQVLRAIGIKNTKKIKTAAIVSKTPNTTNFVGRLEDAKTWIVFPWELSENNPEGI